MVEFNQWGFSDTLCGLCGGKQTAEYDQLKYGRL